MSTIPSTSTAPPHAMYRIGRGESGVMTFEPYKSALLPLCRFRTSALALESSSALWTAFLEYEEADDFVGMDMARKFLLMGMTRAKRYANHKGGRKYGSKGEILECRQGGDGRKEKDESSRIFKKVWDRARKHDGYLSRKEEFLKKQRVSDQARKVEGEGKRAQRRT